MGKKLRVAILPHLGRSITRNTKASRPRVIYDLIEELCLRSHHLTLLGTADSRTKAKNLPVTPQGIFHMGLAENEFYRHISYLLKALKLLEKHQAEFDLVHNHMYPEFLPYILGPQLKIPMVTTIHTEMTDYTVEAFKRFPGADLVALSHSHKQDAEKQGLTIKHIVYNGINLEHFPFSPKPNGYFLFVGRIKIVAQDDGQIYDPKGLLTAIRVAKKARVKLLISGSIENKEMYVNNIKPHLGDNIRFVGKVSKEAPLSREEISKLYQGAQALLFPIAWDEPFGLVLVEANACGTPVIAFKRGAVPELIKNGINGYVVENEIAMIDAVSHIDMISRRNCRSQIESRFSRQIMAENYEKIYYQIIK